MLSTIVRNITPSATVELDGTVRAMKEAGLDVVSLNIGEPDFKSAAVIRQACKDALDACKTTYVNVSGIIELRKAICDKLKNDNQVSYAPDQICVSTGAKQAVFNAVMAVTDPGSEVIIPTPSWVSYVEIVKLAGGIPICVPTQRQDHQLDIEAIKAAISDKTAAILINTPNNPTGAVYSREILCQVAELAIKNDLIVITDEVYEKFVYRDAKHCCIASLSNEVYDRTIVINGFSKAYCMTGWRIGYTAAPTRYAQGIRALQGHVTSNSTSFAQWGALEALKQGDTIFKEMIAEFEQRQEYAYQRLKCIPNIGCGKVDGAFYLLPDVSAYYGKRYKEYIINNSIDLCNYILKEYRTAMVPGSAFFAPNHVRISYTNSMEQIREGFNRLEMGLEKLG